MKKLERFEKFERLKMFIEQELKKIVSGKVKNDEPMSKHTTFRIGGSCDFYVEVGTLKELIEILFFLDVNEIDWFIIGAGSNLLVKDEGISGVVIRLKKEFSDIFIEGETVRVGAGAMLSVLLMRVIEAELSGIEFLAGIPGTVGGAFIMNAGTDGVSISDVLETVKFILPDGEVLVKKKEGLDFSYRKSNFPAGSIILSATLLLKKKNKSDILNRINSLMVKRAENQPLGAFNPGCIFKNPPNHLAGKMIEEVGLKNFTVGGAQVSKNHANFINNLGNATCGDVLSVIKEMEKKVKDKFGVELELEIQIIGK